MPHGIFFITQIKRFLVPFLAVLLVSPLLTASLARAAVAANYTNNGAPAINVNNNVNNVLVMSVTLPDAWNGGAFVADTLLKAGSAFSWQGDALNAIPALGTTLGVGFKEDGTPGFQGTEAVVRDLDSDSVFTSASDVLIDADGTTTTGVGTQNVAIVAGSPLVLMALAIGNGNRNVCTDSLSAPTAMAVKTNGSNCAANSGTNNRTYVLGTNATATPFDVEGTWSFADAIALGGDADGKYDVGEDVFKGSAALVAGSTFSATADVDVYSTGGLTHADALIDFPADCDSAGAGTQACKFTGATPISASSNIFVDEGTAGGAAANSVVDKQADQLLGLGVQNTGTAVNSTDLSAVRVWAENGTTAGFQSGEDSLLGDMTVNSGDNKEWRLGSLVTPILAGGLPIYVTVNTAAGATHGNKMTFQIPVLNDIGSDSIVTQDNDRGVFVSSINDGPQDVAILNANTQTIVVTDVTAPVLAQVTAVPTPTNVTTPSYTFSSTEAGTISYGGGCMGADTTADAGNNTITFNALAAGTYAACTITVTDASLNASTALTVNTFVIDVTAPTVLQDTGVTNPTNDTTPAYIFTSNEAGAITYGGDCSSATVVAINGMNPIVFNALGAGLHNNCTVTVTDAAGNASTPLSVNAFTIDTTGVTLSEVTPIASPDNVSAPSYTFNSDSAGTIAYGGGCSSATTTATVGNNTITFNTLIDGTYAGCTIQVTDAATNPSNVLTVSSFTIDTVLPYLAQVTPVPALVADATPDYTFSSSKAGTISYGGDCASATTVATATNNTITFNTLTQGEHASCTVTVTDAIGNVSLPLAISTFTVDTVAPVLTQVIAVPTPDNDPTPDYTFNSTEAGNMFFGTGCASAVVVTVVASAIAGDNLVTFGPLADATYATCTITVTDAAGNSSTPLAVSSFTIDTMAPSLSEITAVSTPTQASNPAYTFNTNEAGTITVGGSCTSNATTMLAGNNTINFSSLPVAMYTDCTVQVTDAAGNASTPLDVSDFEVIASTGGGPRSIFTHPAVEMTVQSVGGLLVNGSAPVEFTYSVFNRGDVGLSNVLVTSNLCTNITYVRGDNNTDGIVDLSEVWIYTCDTTVTETVTNSALVTSQFNGATVSDPATTVVIVTDTEALCTDVAAATTSCAIDPNDGSEVPFVDAPQTGEQQQIAFDKLQSLGLAAHDLVKVAETKAVYYLGPDARRHVFLNSNTFFTWYCSFDGIKVVSTNILTQIEQGTAVTYRPGVRMIKLADDNKVYAIEKGHTLRWITTEELAIALYGTDWNSKIDDVADFDGYTMGADITSVAEYAPTLAEQSVTLPADAMDPILGYIPSPMGEGLSC